MFAELIELSILTTNKVANYIPANDYKRRAIIVRCDSRQVPQVICNKWIVDLGSKSFKYYVKLTGGSMEFEVNACTYYNNKIGYPLYYFPNTKTCS